MSLVSAKVLTNAKSSMEKAGARAWVDVDIDSIIYNINELKKILPKKCEPMAVLKGNAYGHGAIAVGKALNSAGYKTFSVATLDEGIALRTAGIKGMILILGYTPETEYHKLIEYNLIQTAVDYSHAKSLNAFGRSIQVHVKIDTGMNRLGESFKNKENIKEILSMKKLHVCGIFTHLSVADSLDEEDVIFTLKQIHRFYHLLKWLESEGCSIPKVHVQSSYGVLNYPELDCDYARIGLAMYGALSSKGDRVRSNVLLRPALSLHARIALVKNVLPEEGIGYGREVRSLNKMRIAVVTIGYGDGYPRNLGKGRGEVIVNGEYAKIVGRICMDQLLIDVSKIPSAKQGDMVTLIGSNGEKRITIEDVAEKADTITNEIFSRLGARLEYNK